MKLLISQSAVVPVPACCAPDTAQHNGQFFSAGGSFRVALTAKLLQYCQSYSFWYATLLFHC
jgi:hypothetical protein